MRIVLSFFLSIALSLGFFSSKAAETSLPPLYSEADFNQNGIIEHHEVLTCIEEYIYGNKRYSEEEIYLLIDFYIENAE
ncbi:MAG: hypothetical protein ACPGWM_02420 [Flavobacteriales bacterium]